MGDLLGDVVGQIIILSVLWATTIQIVATDDILIKLVIAGYNFYD